jgi:hypothetical protein
VDWRVHVIAGWELGNVGGHGRRHCESAFELLSVEFAHKAIVLVPWRWPRLRPSWWAVVSARSDMSRPFVALFVDQGRRVAV